MAEIVTISLQKAAARYPSNTRGWPSGMGSKHGARVVSEDEYGATLAVTWLCRILVMIEVALLAVLWLRGMLEKTSSEDTELAKLERDHCVSGY